MKPITVWFDSSCPLCRREIAGLRQLDWRRRIVFVDAITADQASCPVDRAELLARFHVRDTNGDVLHGAAAFAAMWRVIPLLSPLGWLARIPPILWGLERVYRLFLRIRPRLQRWADNGSGL